MRGARTMIFAVFAMLLVAAGAGPVRAQAGGDSAGMPGFKSEAELRAFLLKVRQPRTSRGGAAELAMPPPPPPPPAPAAAPMAAGVEEVSVTGARADSITNNQIQGVDEGDIVKLHGQDLIILRRGRVFSVSIAGGRLKTLSWIDAYAPGVDGRGDWYDEMLVSGDRVVVVGYSYARGGTQVNRFRIGAGGQLSFEDSYQFRSADYYSSRNYATRMIGDQLILYSPIPMPWGGDPMAGLPAMRKWAPGAAGRGAFRRIVNASHVYVPRPLMEQPALVDTFHSVTRCDLSASELSCDSTVVLGSNSRTFFVSENAVYVWTAAWMGGGQKGLLYRMPLDGSRPAAVGVRGFPVDQFSFHPDAARKTLHVLVRAEGGGDRMWRPEVSDGSVALMSAPMASFGDGSRETPLDAYQPLPRPGSDSWNFSNRFVADYLLYGAAGGEAPASSLIAVSLKTHEVTALGVGHQIERIDALGSDAIVIGPDGRALGFTAIDLDADGPRIAERLSLPGSQQGENRSHAFFFHPDAASKDGTSGLIGLPVMRAGAGGTRYLGSSAAIVFLARRGHKLTQAGELAGASRQGSDRDDDCRASCVDWYGNARPIFIGDRIIALMGYELVEGRETAGRVQPVGREDFSPRRRPDASTPQP